MGFEETFGNIVGYSIYFVVGTVWLVFLGIGVCGVLYLIVSFCLVIPCWGFAFSWIKRSIGTMKANLIAGVSRVTQFSKNVFQSLPGILQRVQQDVSSSLRRSGGYRPAATDNIVMAESGSRNSSDQTPLLQEQDTNENDYHDGPPETKFDIVVEPPSRNSIELSKSDNTHSQGSRIGPD